jgi:hypothetical protein
MLPPFVPDTFLMAKRLIHKFHSKMFLLESSFFVQVKFINGEPVRFEVTKFNGSNVAQTIEQKPSEGLRTYL